MNEMEKRGKKRRVGGERKLAWKEEEEKMMRN